MQALKQDAEVPPTRVKGEKYLRDAPLIIDEVGFARRRELSLNTRLLEVGASDRHGCFDAQELPAFPARMWQQSGTSPSRLTPAFSRYSYKCARPRCLRAWPLP